MSEAQTRASGAHGDKPGPSAADAHPTEVSGVDPTRAGEPPGEASATPPTLVEASHLAPLGPGVAFGVYRLEKKLGEGGMGAVWKALHTRLDKHVALKVLPQSFSRDPGMIARFEREMKAVGKLDHPHIVRAMDAGEVGGTHFLAMEYLDGVDLNQVVKQNGPRPVAEACEMLRQAALGLAYAHQNGLIHRDIKPTNLFLAKPGRIKVLDLGLARLHGESATSEADGPLTRTGQVLGTPEYMAPEQWDDTHAADGRADQYALGCTLFFLLTGRAPFSDEKHNSLVRKMKGHTSEPPPDLKRERPDAPDSVCAVYQKLMAKTPEERYATADELATVLMGIVKQINTGGGTETAAPAAPPPSKPAAAKAAAPKTVPEHPRAAPAKKPSKKVEHDPDTEWEPDPEPALPVRGRPAPRRLAKPASGRGSRGMSPQAKIALGAGGGLATILLVVVVGYALGKRGGDPSPGRPGDSPAGTPTATTSNGSTTPPPVPSGDGAAAKPTDPASPWKTVEPKTPAITPQPVTHKPGERLSPTSLVARPAILPGLLSWTIEPISPSGGSRAVGVSDDGRLVATWGMSDAVIRLYEAVGDPPTEFKLRNALFGQNSPPQSLAFSPDNTLLASTSYGSTWNSDVFLWDVATGRKVRTINGFSSYFALFSPDGGRLALYGPYGVTTLNLRTNQTREYRGVGGDGRDLPLAISAAWSPDGTQLVTGGKKMRLWDPDTLGVLHEWAPNEKGPTPVAWSPDGERIASIAPDKVLSIWNSRTRELDKAIEIQGAMGGPPWVAWLSDSRRVAIGLGPRSYILHDADTGRLLAEMPPTSAPTAVAWSRNGRFAVSSGMEPPGYYHGATHLRDGDTWGVRASIPKLGRIEHSSTALSADGRRLATRNLNQVAAWDAENGRLLHRWTLPENGQVACAPAGDRIAAFNSILNDDCLVLYDPATGGELRPLVNQALGVTSFAWSPDGDRFATVNNDRKIRIYKSADGKIQKTLDGHIEEVLSVCWAPDGKRLASISSDGVIHVWEPAKPKPVATHKDLPSRPSTYYRSGVILAFSSDGDRLIIALESDVADLELTTGKLTVRDDGKETRSIRQFVTGKTDASIVIARNSNTAIALPGRELLSLTIDGSPMLPLDERRLLIHVNHAMFPCVQSVLSIDPATGREFGAFLPHLYGDNHVCISADGHYQGSRDIDQHIVFAALHEDGTQAIYTPTEFARKFGWKNDVLKATLAPAH